jgi:outer membrane receptor protein involved in Fe transport
MLQLKTISYVTLLIQIFISNTLFGQKDTLELHQLSIEDLRNVKIKTASKRSEKILTAPSTVYVITSEEIKNFGYNELQDALESIPSIYLSNPHSWIWGGQRGLLSNFSQTLLMLNGREVNNLVAYEGFISHQFATHNIKQIEIIASPASALYGANALAGIINIITKEDDELYEGAELHIEAGSYKTIASGFTFGTKLNEDLRLSGSARFYQSDGQDFSDWVTNTSEFTPSWADNSLTQYYQNFSDYSNFSMSIPVHMQLNYKGLYAGVNHYKNIQGHGQESPSWSYTDREDIRKYTLSYFGYEKKLSEKLNLQFDFTHINSKFYGRYFQGLWPVARLQAPATANVYSFDTWTPQTGPRAGNNFEMLGYNQSNALVYDQTEGDSLYLQDYYPSFAWYLIDQNIIDSNNISRDDIHNYLQHIYTNKNSIGSTKEKVNLTIGYKINPNHHFMFGYAFEYVRFIGLAVTDAGYDLASTYNIPVDLSKRNSTLNAIKQSFFYQYQGEIMKNRLWLSIGARFDHQNTYGATFNPRCGIVYQFYPGSTLKLLYGEAFREGNFFELTANPNLKPAKLRTTELVFSQKIKTAFQNDLALYNNKVTNFISSVSSLIGENVASVEQQTCIGLENTARLSYMKFSAFGSGAFMLKAAQLAENTNGEKSDVNLPGIPRFKLSAGLTYKVNKILNLSLLNHFVDRYNAIGGSSSSLIQIQSYNNLSFTVLAHNINIKPNSSLDLVFSVKNLLDSKYFHANIRQSGTEKFLQNGRHFQFRCTLKI